jgi:hypothetical protein
VPAATANQLPPYLEWFAQPDALAGGGALSAPAAFCALAETESAEAARDRARARATLRSPPRHEHALVLARADADAGGVYCNICGGDAPWAWSCRACNYGG